MTEQEFFGKTDFSFEISGGSDEIVIQVYIDIVSDRPRTLIASFQVDSLEMIESARIPLNAGSNHVPFQQTVRIVKPLLWQPNGAGIPSLYSFTVVFHQKGEPFYLIEKRVGIRFVETRPGELFFRVNGKAVQLVRCDPDFSLEEKEFERQLRGNLVCLQDSDSDLEKKLEYCGRTGLIAVLELTGAADPDRFCGQPGVCLFTAEPGSAGERLYRQNGKAVLPPLFTREELNLLLNDKKV
ncbi:MAG: hypothetical protein J5858_05830 [Lentisphaeria bacterium]|nr:hypothetical protein [Lentisphaeria bacterium]